MKMDANQILREQGPDALRRMMDAAHPSIPVDREPDAIVGRMAVHTALRSLPSRMVRAPDRLGDFRKFLDELRPHTKFMDTNQVVETLIEIARTHRVGEPEGIITQMAREALQPQKASSTNEQRVGSASPSLSKKSTARREKPSPGKAKDGQRSPAR